MSTKTTNELTLNLRMLPLERAAAEIGVSVSNFKKLKKAPGFPKPRRIGKQLRYRVADLLAWILAQPEGDGNEE